METLLPNRQSIRLKGWDYSSPGWYFVTATTQDMRSLFGTIGNGRMALNDVGRMVREMWLAVGAYHSEYRLDEFVVMPNHVHGLVYITGGHNGPPLRSVSLPDFVRRFKSTSDIAWRKMFVVAVGAGRCACPNPDSQRNGKLWQRNYWDVIVRDARTLANNEPNAICSLKA